ncbi:hypothetical protein OS175_00150 [Marinicella sp. S1101]|uniref:hypothetical protein n=1 Tax=Marinicella marina TaxID=2996016 RepID=UPI002260A90D|nr:hypothetical protein [Marinicella marina]MCX7552272.1 hypothetical protein [Marinicella marina]MDJ1139148.1 hypothetical protein [Marinicella marina]
MMLHQKTLAAVFVLLLTVSNFGSAQSTNRAEQTPPTWQPNTDVEVFWMAYTQSKGGLTWGRSAQYPEYNLVKEGDTFMVELSQGPCLMEFFHSRWRRANDVRRWDDSINEYGGCPFVFD